MKEKLPSTNILGVSITTSSKSEILEYILKCISSKHEKVHIVTPNPEMLVYASRSRSFRNILNNAEVAIPDGVGVTMAGRMLNRPVIERITGVDFMEMLCHESAKRGLTVGFLGGRGGVAEKTAECLIKKYPNLIVGFIGEEWETAGPAALHPRAASPTGHIDILFVAFGFPKQEEWIAKNLPKIDVTAAMGVGGAFDYISGKIPRAPKIFRDFGMEWAFRLVRQPWRIKRQMALPVFAWHILFQKLFGNDL